MAFTVKDRRILLIWYIKGFLITLILMIFYEAHYHGMDTYTYVQRAFLRTFPAPLIPGEGTDNIPNINNYFTQIVGESYYSLKIINSLIGFMGLLFIYRSFEYTMQKSKIEIHDNFIYFFFLFPTIVFWSSILGKDPLNLFFIGLFTYAFIHLIDSFKLRYLLMIVASIIMVSYIRSWWSIIMVTSIFLYYIKINSFRSFMIFLLILPVFIILGMGFLKTAGVGSMEDLFLKMAETSKNLAYGGSSVGVHIITGFGDYLLWFPMNFFTSLFRPMFWDVRNPFTLVAAIENMILLYYFYKYVIKNWGRIFANKYLKFYILLTFAWSLLYVIISPTNLGMAVRFKLQVLPLMLALIGASQMMIETKKE